MLEICKCFLIGYIKDDLLMYVIDEEGYKLLNGE